MTSTYPNESAGITDWREDVGRTVKTDGCVLFLCTEGCASVSANMQKTSFGKGDLLTLTADVHLYVLEVSPLFSARYVSLSEAMTETAYYKITDMALWNRLHFAPVSRLSAKQRELVDGWMEQTEWILANSSGPDRVAMLNNNVHNLFLAIGIELMGHDDRGSRVRKDRSWALMSRFLSLVAKHSSSEREVAFYADAMNISPGYLYKVCRRAFGMSPKQLIVQQLAVEIKTYLADTHLSVKDIAYRLGFEDSSYMCRFFRRITGVSPTEFRNGMAEDSR